MEAICDRSYYHILYSAMIYFVFLPSKLLTYYRDDFIIITGKSNAELPVFVKKSIGAFWGMVFKFVLKYNGQKSVSVSMNDYFKVKTATYFIKEDEV